MDSALSEMTASKNNFMELTHELNNYNEIYNKNVYLKSIVVSELDKLQAVEDGVKTSVMKQKQDYMAADYGLHLFGVRAKIMMWTVVVACGLLLVIATHLSGRVAQLNNVTIVVSGCSAVVLVWFLVVYLTLRSYTNRRANSWSQFYWRPAFT